MQGMGAFNKFFFISLFNKFSMFFTHPFFNTILYTFLLVACQQATALRSIDWASNVKSRVMIFSAFFHPNQKSIIYVFKAMQEEEEKKPSEFKLSGKWN